MPRKSCPAIAANRGAVIIMVLWTAVVLTILVTVLAANVRLSANTAFHNRTGSQDYTTIMAAMNQAEMELMMERMPIPIGQPLELSETGDIRIPAYRFNGQALTLAYPADEELVIRIYDHAGKINLNRIRPERLQQIIEKKLGPGFNPRQVQELLAAWTDWTDLNSQMTLGGAEDEYYQSLDPPYLTRNTPELDTVEEILLIRGFEELFSDVNLEAAFTVYGSDNVVNPNLATREALRLLPGTDEELVEQIITRREQADFRVIRDVGDVVPLERMVELSPWLGFNTSSFYSVYVHPAHSGDAGRAWLQIMEVRSYENRARIYRIHPYAQLPASRSSPTS